eukprot:2006973-Alexandrium_andersonii.AAC.1
MPGAGSGMLAGAHKPSVARTRPRRGRELALGGLRSAARRWESSPPCCVMGASSSRNGSLHIA